MEGSLGNSLGMLLLMLLALAAAWYLGKLNRPNARPARQDGGRDYFIGLNYLLNEQPDEAIDTFIAALEVNTDALETHLALGTLLRRRGKVDKSIVVYQKLLERPQLADYDASRIKLELVRSYIAAGLLDRAEQLLEELSNAGPELRHAALLQAISLYQLERDWARAVEAAEELLRITTVRERSRYQVMASHFQCELAEQAIAEERYGDALACLKKALQLHRGNVRASLLVARVEMAQDKHQDAVKALTRVRQQDPDFESETIVPLMQSYARLESGKPLQKFFAGGLEDELPASVVLAFSEHIEQHSGRAAALGFLRERLERTPSLKVMNRLLHLLGEEAGGLQQDLRTFHRILHDYLKSRPMYRCGNCGYEVKNLYWLCPSCVEWGTIKPIKGVMGE